MAVINRSSSEQFAGRADVRPAVWSAIRESSSLVRRRISLISRVLAVTLLCAAADLPLWQTKPLLFVLNLPVTGGFVLTGLLLRDEPGQRGTSWALILAGVTHSLGWLNVWGTGPLPLYSVVFGYLDNIFGAWVLLRYPHTQMSRHQRIFVAAAALWLIPGPIFLCLISTPTNYGFAHDTWWLGFWPEHRLFVASSTIFDLGATVLAIMFLALLIDRGLEGGRRERAIVQPIVFAGVLAGITAGSIMVGLAISGPSDELFSIEAVAELSVPVAFMASISQQRLIRMASMVNDIHQATPTSELLQQVLRIHLRDPDLQLLVWSSDQKIFVSLDGSPAIVPLPSNSRLNCEVTGGDGQPLALLITYLTTTHDSDLLTTAVAMTRLTLENTQLSRRLVTTEYLARQEVAADLHDGAQAALCGLRVILAAAARTADPITLRQLNEARGQVDTALRDLRDLSYGIYPHTLARFGLHAALEETAARLDLPTTITTPAHALAPAIEKTVYFVICEALTNSAKHAAPSTVNVTIQFDGTAVLAAVIDDGHGGANPSGLGLARLSDRVQALGGGLTVESVPGSGTCIRARIPCA